MQLKNWTVGFEVFSYDIVGHCVEELLNVTDIETKVGADRRW